MSIRARIANVFAFRTLPTTIVVALLYAAIFLAVFSGDALPTVPSPDEQHGLNLNSAYRDLQTITVRPHPYNSRENDVVRYHILNRLQAVASQHPHVHVANDIVSNLTWAELYGVYLEGTNVLVKIDGENPDLKGVLFSAHYDCVSTSHGATDNGMGVVTLIQLVHYFAQNRPKKTLVFNFNNDEEDSLGGARAFLVHPWASLVDTFLNLEGAGAGGRPILFRATSTRMTRAFQNVPHPHGSALTADAFKRHLVRSSTDYSVYTNASMSGLDFAFYKHRSKYHTLDDSIPSLGGKAALWNMMESSLFAGKALAEDESSGGDDTPVYFDLFGETIAIFSLTTFFVLNLVMLVAGPLLVGGLVFLTWRKRKLYWSTRGWGRFPTAVVLSAGATIGLGILYTYVNPFIVYSSPYAVLASTLSLAYLATYVPIALFTHFRPIPQQKSLILTQTYVLWWLVLVFDTVLVRNFDVAGFYFMTFFHASTLIAVLVGLAEHFELPPALRRRAFRRAAEVHESREELAGDDVEENASERTPLIRQNGTVYVEAHENEENQFVLWLVQVVLAISFPVILTMQVSVLAVNALPQTLADGNDPLLVYLGLSLISFLAVLPTAPFAHKLHRSLFYALLVVFLATGVYNLLAFPFSSDSALKIFFQQTIDLDSGVNTVSLTGVPSFTKELIIPEIPSTWSKVVSCSGDPLKPGLDACKWGGIDPVIADSSYEDWLTVNATLFGPGSALIAVQGVHTRSCRLYFDSPISNLRVNGSSGTIEEGYPIPSGGLREVRLWSRSWEREFVVEIGWDGSAGISGRAACEWVEDGIPALDEVRAFLPKWAILSKRTDGLLEGWKAFSM